MNFEAQYEREGSPGWKIKSWEDANQLLGYQKADGPSFTIFTIGNGGFVQCAGSKTKLKVEAKVKSQNGGSKHYRFGKGQLSGDKVQIECNCGPITVDSSQVLKMKDARLIIRYFVENSGELLAQYEAQELTDVL